MRALLITAPLALAAAMPAAAQPGPQVPPLTRQQALDLPPAEVADIVFRQLGARMAGMERPIPSAWRAPDSLGTLRFATAPRPGNDFGLCAATVVAIGFEPAPAEPGGQPPRAFRASSVETATVYKVVDEIRPGVEPAEVYQAQMEQRCAHAGPVISPRGDLGEHVFFFFRGASHPWLALRALHRAIRDARETTYTNIGCDPEERPLLDCRDPAGALARLDLADLLDLTIAPAAQGEKHFRIEATFLISADGSSQLQWGVVLEARIGVSDDARTVTIELGRAVVSQARMAFD